MSIGQRQQYDDEEHDDDDEDDDALLANVHGHVRDRDCEGDGDAVLVEADDEAKQQ